VRAGSGQQSLGYAKLIFQQGMAFFGEGAIEYIPALYPSGWDD
jgi:hypothetical protein